jgi:hypothetical protein
MEIKQSTANQKDAPMKWVTTKVEDESDYARLGIKTRVGVGNFTGDPETLPLKWRVLDDDKNEYASGRADVEDFDPLDFFAADQGATDLQFLKAGKWVSL